MKCLPSALLEEDPDLLSTLLAYIEWHDKEQERLAKQAKRR